ncbi:MAG: class I SAM-dependent methyltransferase [Negativicutes bacterium]|jgi:ubiquinone/menaquinone biosynthesis C-methylase UbiE
MNFLKKAVSRVFEKKMPENYYNERCRDNWIIKQLQAVPAGAKILDAGAGEQPYKKYCNHMVYVSQDFAAYNGRGNEKGLQMGIWDQKYIDIISDITAIPVDDDSFDVVLCSEVLEHLPEPVMAIREFARVLRDGGKLILTAPFCSLTHFAPYHFCTGFSEYWYYEHLISNGFEIVELSKNGNYFSFMDQELCRLRYVYSRYSTKGLSLCILVLIKLLSWYLKRTNDIGSNDLLYFGCHVVAVKKEKVDEKNA